MIPEYPAAAGTLAVGDGMPRRLAALHIDRGVHGTMKCTKAFAHPELCVILARCDSRELSRSTKLIPSTLGGKRLSNNYLVR
jgi:hypothetical protein